MVCIYCGHKTKITNSREKRRDKGTWRRRQCLSCQATFTTHEGLDWSKAIAFKTKSGKLEPFYRDKLFISVHDSLKHRKDALEASTALTDTILIKLIPRLTNAVIKREIVIQTTTEVLKRFDKPAATAYTAFHPL